MLNSPVFKRKKDSKAFQVLIISYIEIFRGLRLFVPDGFCWDGASIPRVLWRLYGHPLTNKYQAAAVVHDWLYKIKGEYDRGYSMTRKEVDQLFYHMLSICVLVLRELPIPRPRSLEATIDTYQHVWHRPLRHFHNKAWGSYHLWLHLWPSGHHQTEDFDGRSMVDSLYFYLLRRNMDMKRPCTPCDKNYLFLLLWGAFH